MKIRVAFLAGSPVYYHALLYRRLAADPHINFTAIFASNAGAVRPLDDGYGQPVEWGIDPLVGYQSVFLRRADQNPPDGGILGLHDLDVVKMLASERYDVLCLHGYHSITHIAAALTQRALRKPRLFRTENSLQFSRRRWKTLVKSVGLGAYFRGAYGLYIGTQSRRWLERWGVAGDRLFAAPYVVDNDALQAAARELHPLRQQLRLELRILDEPGPVILAVGRLIPKKGLHHLLGAFRDLRATRRCTLLLVGSGPMEDELRRRVAEERIPNVVFAGFLDQTKVTRAYAVADVFVLASTIDETWGLVVNEAMNFGLPIIVSDNVGCAVDLVIDGKNGRVVRSGDSNAILGALQEVTQSDDLMRRFGDASVEMITAWNLDRTVAGVVEALQSAVGVERWNSAA